MYGPSSWVSSVVLPTLEQSGHQLVKYISDKVVYSPKDDAKRTKEQSSYSLFSFPTEE